MEAVASGVGASVGVAALARRWFRHAVRDVVSESVADLIKRQAEFERRQGQHLDLQDQRLQRIEQKLGRRWLPGSGERGRLGPGRVSR